MKIERTKNATRNIVFNGMAQLLNMLIPFVMRSVILHFLGVEYLGLGGLFRSIFSVLSLAELGIGSAMIFSMYKPIAEDDTETICAMMRLYKIVYRIIGLVVLGIGLILIPFLPYLVKDEVTADVNLYILYFMNLGSTVVSYWLFAYKHSIISAHQRDDIASKVIMVVHLIEYALKIAVLIILKNYYIYLTLQIISQIAYNIIVAYRASKIFPQYSARGKLSRDKIIKIACRVRDLFTSQFSNVISNSSDTLVISSFLGLTVLAVYQNYFYIISSLKTFIEVVSYACVAGIGNSLVTESIEKNYRDLRKITVLFGWIMGISSTMFLCLAQPFMHIWMGEDNMLSFEYVVCFTIYHYSLGMNRLLSMFKDAAGIWRIDRWRPLVAAIVNLGLNLATVKWLGLYGVILSTVISIVLVQIPWLFHNLFKAVYPKEYMWEYIRLFLSFSVVSFIACITSWFLCSIIHLDVWPTLFINFGISFASSNLIFFAVYGRNELFKESVSQIIRVIFRRK